MPVSTDGAGSGVSVKRQASLGAVVLHKDEIPDLHRRVALAVDPFRMILFRIVRLVAHVIMDLRARPARAGIAHLPKIILAAKAQDPFGFCTDFFPKRARLIIGTDLVIALKEGKP